MTEPEVDIGKLVEDTTKYVETKFELAKLQTAEKVTDGFSSLVAIVIITSIAMIFLFMLSFTLAAVFAEITDSYIAGLGIVSGIYLLIVILLVSFRSKLLKMPIMNYTINFIFDDKEKVETEKKATDDQGLQD